MEAGGARVTPAAELLTVGDLIGLYIGAVGPVTPTPGVQELARSHIAGFVAADLSRKEVADWAEDLGYRHGELPAPVQALGEVLEEGRKNFGVELTENPVHALFAKTPEVRDRRIGPSEEDLLLREAARSRGGYLRDLLIMGFETALRQPELVILRWDDVELDADGCGWAKGTVPVRCL